ncbi:DUF262 domain-containing protein [Mesorhizobium sp. BR1-1-9]|uniref:GmrSD restriction endonuclease domain-containing protein n=1 Tax=Mesorhizobium sp. BR1-1-9 TaxID=2876646 RepID=UPI001CD1603C|nr:DUF262 domain-containing protein [Mesorhizobium sp. BR1-1-9]MBZ9870897.1 DUF262 domain-containing protein [Mesorhizobium sp. BR1-1-9]
MAQQAKLAQRQLADLLFPVRASRSEDDEGILNVPLNERRLQTETYDFTISTIETLLKDEKIVIPDFQRKYVWTRNQASRLIESLIIQCPIPVVYLDQEDDGTLKVIDGNQRLMSIRLFLENGFKLKGLRAFPDLNGFLFRELDPRFRTHIENRTIRCITILKETHPQIKFDVFERLNTGAVQLNPQELRHGLYHGRLMELLDELGEYEPWQALSGIKDDKRMRGAELILRFLALCFKLDEYEKPLASFLNKFAQNNRDAKENDAFANTFMAAVDSVQSMLGNKAFRLLDERGEPDNNFNAAIFDAQMVGFALAKRSAKDINAVVRKGLMENYQALQSNRDYHRAVSASTSDPPLVRYRITMFRDLIERIIP